MIVRAQIISGFLAVLFTFLVLSLIRNKKLKESYSLIWLIAALVAIPMAVSNGLLLSITKIFGATDPRSTVYFFSIFFIAVFILHFSVKMSLLSEQVKDLTQENALLRNKLDTVLRK